MAKHRATPRGKRPIAPEVPAAEHQQPALRVSRQEILWLLAILAAGVALRWMFLSRVAVEHFDEGVYASNIWFGAEDFYQYPLRCLYAPPLLPALIESALAFQQIVRPSPAVPSPLAVMLPSLLAGSLTPLALWWLARRWFTPAVAIGACDAGRLQRLPRALQPSSSDGLPVGFVAGGRGRMDRKGRRKGRGTRYSDGRSADRRGLVDQVQRLVAAGDRRSRYRLALPVGYSRAGIGPGDGSTRVCCRVDCAAGLAARARFARAIRRLSSGCGEPRPLCGGTGGVASQCGSAACQSAIP